MAENQIQNQDQNGPIGLAVKAFLLAFEISLEDNGDDPTIPPGLGYFTNEQYGAHDVLFPLQHGLKSVVTDAARFLPELAPLVAGIVQSPVKRRRRDGEADEGDSAA